MKQVKAKYGLFLIDSDSLYSLEKIDEVNIFKTSLRLKNELNNYETKINKYVNQTVIKGEDVGKSELQKHFIELIVKDILLANQNVERFKDTYIMVNKEKIITLKDNTTIKFYP